MTTSRDPDSPVAFSWPRVFVSFCGNVVDATGKITEPERKAIGSFVVFGASETAYVVMSIELRGADWWLVVV